MLSWQPRSCCIAAPHNRHSKSCCFPFLSFWSVMHVKTEKYLKWLFAFWQLGFIYGGLVSKGTAKVKHKLHPQYTGRGQARKVFFLNECTKYKEYVMKKLRSLWLKGYTKKSIQEIMFVDFVECSKLFKFIESGTYLIICLCMYACVCTCVYFNACKCVCMCVFS